MPEYFTGTIVEANLDGTHAKTIVKRQYEPTGVAVAGGHLYWINLELNLMEANPDGTHAKKINSQGGFAGGLAAGGAHLYWADFNDKTIVEASLNGTHSKTIAKRQANPQAVAFGP